MTHKPKIFNGTCLLFALLVTFDNPKLQWTLGYPTTTPVYEEDTTMVWTEVATTDKDTDELLIVTESELHDNAANTVETETNFPEITTTTEATDSLIQNTLHNEADKEEIINDLQSIWVFTENLGEDQKDLKTSLSSLVHMTYARVYEQTDETLIRLQYLLKRLRARLLGDSNKRQVISENTMSGSRNRRSLKQKTSNISTTIMFASANPSGNSLYPGDEKSANKFSSAEDLHQIKFHKIFSVKDVASNVPPKINKTLPYTVTRSNNISTHSALIENLKQKHILSLSKANTMHSITGNGSSITAGNQSEEATLNKTIHDIVKSIIEILVTPIAKPVRNKPLPELSALLEAESQNVEPPDNVTSPNSGINYSNLPPYFHQVALSLYDRNSTSAFETGLDSLLGNAALGNTHVDLDGSRLEFWEETGLGDEDISGPSDPQFSQSMVNGTLEKIIVAVNTVTSMPNASRFILLFSITISIVTIALGLYSLGPPTVAIGVLGVIVPVILLFLLHANNGRRKSGKQDKATLQVDDVIQILDMVKTAIEKYESIQGFQL